MPSLESSFRELQQRLRDSSSLGNTGGDPVYYLVFQPQEMLTVKRKLKAWKAKLKLDDWEVEVLSLARVIGDFFANHPLRQFWLSGEQDHDLVEVNETLRAALVDTRLVETKILEALKKQETKPKGLLLITDIEALHPYLRIGAIEQRLQGKVNSPTIILYPGERRGQSNLSFLGIYPDDGNYRSIHIGG
jgi:hypothetical protein